MPNSEKVSAKQSCSSKKPPKLSKRSKQIDEQSVETPRRRNKPRASRAKKNYKYEDESDYEPEPKKKRK